jgi:hypothetical protein
MVSDISLNILNGGFTYYRRDSSTGPVKAGDAAIHFTEHTNKITRQVTRSTGHQKAFLFVERNLHHLIIGPFSQL